MGDSDGRPEDRDSNSLGSLADSPQWKQAESFRKAEIYGRAAKSFRQFWEESHNPEAGWRYAQCLRKSGLLELALGLLTELEREFPDHFRIREQLVWSIYEGRLLPAKAKGDNAAIVEAGRAMVSAEATGIALRLAVFAVMGVAKTRGQWKLVSNWCDLLDPSTLNSKAKVTNNGSIPSDRERWYFAKVKALVQQEEWHRAVNIADLACQDFPDNADFLRWKASSLAGLGQRREAIELLDTLRPKIAWYAIADMARYSLELEDVEGAWMLAQEAAAAIGQDSAKVNLWELMSRASLALGMPDAALHHAGLMEAIRKERDWPLRPSHRELISKVLAENNLEQMPKRPSREWKSLCRDHWQIKSASTFRNEAPQAQGQQLDGRVVSWDESKSFAFIAPASKGEAVFVLVQDLPEDLRHNGAKVKFRTIRHFDKRRNRDSIRAVQVEANK